MEYRAHWGQYQILPLSCYFVRECTLEQVSSEWEPNLKNVKLEAHTDKDITDAWTIYVDGSSYIFESGAEIVIVSSDDQES